MSVRQLFHIVFLVLGMHLSRLKYMYAFVLILVIASSGALWLLFGPPVQFPAGQALTVPSGVSASAEAVVLKNKHYVHSALLFRELVRFTPGVHGVQSGVYMFARPVSVFTVAWHLSHGISGIPTVKVTFPEGTTVRQMGKVLATSLPTFDEQKFDAAALPAEGFLFPDTYFFLPGTSETAVIGAMRANYSVHIQKFSTQIAASGKIERDIVIMASLLEGEGKTLDDKRMIAGILWNRIRSGMPLQVDAPFGYIYGKTGYTPTATDLKDNSAYNTYRYTGLPPTPINNPGDISILAALTPTKTDNLYYLTGTDGTMHYAKTFAEHVTNQKKYLK